MKKIFTFFAAMIAVVALNAQSVDYELRGFLDGDNNYIDEITLGMNDDLNPKVALINNGPDVPASADTIYIDIAIMGENVGSMYLMGAQLASVTAGAGCCSRWK